MHGKGQKGQNSRLLMLWMPRTAETVVIPSRSARGRSFPHRRMIARRVLSQKHRGEAAKTTAKNYRKNPVKTRKKHGGAQENQRKAGERAQKAQKIVHFRAKRIDFPRAKCYNRTVQPVGNRFLFYYRQQVGRKTPEGRRCATRKTPMRGKGLGIAADKA